ncbi:MAG: hypothetical protein ABEJ68_07240 [Halobacteriaceae archaeon]
MTPPLRRLVASLSLLVVVPVCVTLAYLGHAAGYYPFLAVPLALAGLLVVTYAVLFAVVR